MTLEFLERMVRWCGELGAGTLSSAKAAGAAPRASRLLVRAMWIARERGVERVGVLPEFLRGVIRELSCLSVLGCASWLLSGRSLQSTYPLLTLFTPFCT